jgi:serine/threonine protein kinase
MEAARHPSIVQLVEIVFDSNLICVIMEYCSNGELFDIIAQQGRLDESMCRRIFSEVVEGIIYIHGKDIAHRDLKPENILLDANMHARIGDFGLCHDTNPRTLLDTPCGSLFYAPPEVISNQKYDGKLSDIWSLGVVLYTMASGALPWKETNQAQLVKQICEAEYTLPRHFSPSLKDLVSKLLKVEPSERLPIAEVAKHPWLQEPDDALLQSQLMAALDGKEVAAGLPLEPRNSAVLPERGKFPGAVRRPLIVRPTHTLTPTAGAAMVKQMGLGSSSGGVPQLLRRVPPSTGVACRRSTTVVSAQPQPGS